MPDGTSVRFIDSRTVQAKAHMTCSNPSARSDWSNNGKLRTRGNHSRAVARHRYKIYIRVHNTPYNNA